MTAELSGPVAVINGSTTKRAAPGGGEAETTAARSPACFITNATEECVCQPAGQRPGGVIEDR